MQSRPAFEVEAKSAQSQRDEELLHLDDIIHVVAHRHEEIKEQFATILHLLLHGAAPLERLRRTDNQG